MEAPKNRKSSEFHVLLSGMKLPAKLEKKIALSIQSAVSSALADYPNPDDPDGKDGPVGGGSYVLIPNKDWLGRHLLLMNKVRTVLQSEIEAEQRVAQERFQSLG